MNSNNPVNRKLLNITMLVVLAPLYAMVLFAPSIGVLRTLAEYWSSGAPFAAPLLYVFALAYLVSMAWVLWRGTLVGPVTLLVLAMLASGMTNAQSSSKKTYTLSIGAGDPILGIDVYCNNVHLGKTPLTLSQADFNKKVTPWDTPPDQPVMMLGEHDENNRYSWAKFFHVPHDILEDDNQRPPDHERYSRHNDKETLEDIRQSKYWWRFEKNGCVGLTSLANFRGGSHGSNGRITIAINPDVTFLSANQHLDVLLAQLQANDLQPTEAWLNHFLKYEGLLFMGFYERAMHDKSLRPTLDAIVRAEFDLTSTPSESDCRRVVDEIVSRAAKSHSFTVVSLESLAIEMVAKAHSQPIVDRFLEPIKADFSGLNSNGRRGRGTRTTYRRSGPRAGRLPLEYAIRKTTPPQLFDRLVYMSRNGSSRELLCNYPGEEVVRLYSHFLRNVEQQGGQRRDSRIRNALQLCSQVDNPLLEDTIRQFVRENAAQGISMKHYVGQFIESRIDNPNVNQGELATWIFHWAPLDDRDKLTYLRQIQDPNACSLFSMANGRNSNRYDDVMAQLGNNPNPAFDTFIIDTYNSFEKPQGRGQGSQSFTLALVNTNTPAMREFIKTKWNQDSKTRTRMINQLKASDWREPHMTWLVPMIAELTTQLDRVSAARLLSRIDTAEAYQLAEQWAADSDSDSAAEATAQLKIRDDRMARQQRQLALAADLLSGKMKPDDLLTPTTAYTWNGTEYIPDKTAQ